MKIRLNKALRVALLAALVYSPSMYGDTIPSTGTVTSDITVNDGSATSVTTLKIDNTSGGTASITLEDSGLTTTATSTSKYNYIGYSGNGSLSILGNSSATFACAMSIAQYSAASNGSVAVTGNGATLTSTASVNVANKGTGRLTISDGGTVTIENGTADYSVSIGTQAGSNGTVEVRGNGSTLTTSSRIYVGNKGTGTLTISAGGAVNILGQLSGNGALNVGYSKGSTGTVAVIGYGSTLSACSRVFVGYNSSGSLTISDGGAVMIQRESTGDPAMTVGTNSSSTGSVDVTGAGSTLSANAAINVGSSGTGSLTISKGATVTILNETEEYDAMSIGLNKGSTGTVEVTGEGSALTTNGNFTVGSTGTGTLRISDEGTVNIQSGTTGLGSMVIGNKSGSTGTVEVIGDGSTLTIGSLIYVGNNKGTGSLTISDGGSVDIQRDSTEETLMIIGNVSGSTGTVNVIGDGSTLNTKSGIYVGYKSTGNLSISDGATVTIQNESQDYSMAIGIYSTSAGTVEVTGDGSTLTTNSELNVGYSGTGNLTISDGGAVTIQNELTDYSMTIGQTSTSTGTVNVTGGNSTISITSSQGVGLCVGYEGTGILSINNGGKVHVLNSETKGATIQGPSKSTGNGTVQVSGTDSLLSIEGLVDVGSQGKGTLTVEDSGVVDVTGDFAVLSIGTTANIGSTSGTGTMTLSNGATVNVGYAIMVDGSLLSMDSTCTLTTANLYVSKGSPSSLTLGGTNSVGTFYVEYGDETSDLTLTLLASGASVSQGGIVVSDQLVQTDGTTTFRTSDSMIDWANVSVELDLSHRAEDLIGNRIFLIKEGEGYEDFGDGLLIEGENRDVDTENYITFTKTVNGQTYTLNYVYDGISLTFGDKVTITPEGSPVGDEDDGSVYSIERTERIVKEHIVGDVEHEDDHDHTTYTPNLVTDEPITYVVSQEINSDESDFQIATTTFRRENIYTYRNAQDAVLYQEITKEDLGLHELTLYVNASDSTVSEGVLGLEECENEHHEGGHAMINNVLVTNGGSLTLTNGNIVNANHHMEANNGSITLDNATMNIGSGNFDNFRENEYIDELEIDFDPLADSTMENVSLQMSNGSTLNFIEDQDDEAATEVTISNSTIQLSAGSSINFTTEALASSDSLDTEESLDTVDNDAENATQAMLSSSPMNVTVAQTAIDLDSGSSLNTNGVNTSITNTKIELSDGSSANFDRGDSDTKKTLVVDNSTIALSEGTSFNATGVETTVTDSTFQLTNGASVNFENGKTGGTMMVSVAKSTLDLSDTSSFNGGNGVVMSVTNSNILGVGKVSGFSSNNNNYTAGKNNVGVLELKNVASTNDTMGTSIVGANALSGTHNTDTTNVISQLKLSDGTAVTNGAFELNVVGDSSLLTDGTSFQVLDLESSLNGGFSSFTETGTALMDGYSWDYSLLNSDGIVSIIFANLGDGPRIANTMYSAAQTVSYAGQVAMDHLANYYAGSHNFKATGNNFWVSSLGTYQCVGNHKGRTGYTFRSLGYAVGYDRAFSDRVIEGIDLGQTWGKHYPKQGTARYSGGKIDQDAMVATLYGMETLLRTGDQKDEINLLHSVSFGKVSNKSMKTALFNNKTATAKWDDDVWSFGLRGVWDHRIDDHWSISPFVGVEYEHVSQNDFTERMDNNTARYTGGSYQNLDLSVGTATGYTIKFQNNMELTTNASIAYVGSAVRNVPTVSVSNANGEPVREKAVNPGRNALEATAGILWKVSDSTNVSAHYSFYAAHDTTEHNANVMVSYAF